MAEELLVVKQLLKTLLKNGETIGIQLEVKLIIFAHF